MREQFTELGIRMRVYPRQDVDDVFVRVDSVGPACADERVEHCSGSASAFAAEHNEVLFPYAERAKISFGKIIVGSESQLHDIASEFTLLIDGVGQSLAERGLRQECRGFDLFEKPVHDPVRPFFAQSEQIFVAGSILLHVGDPVLDAVEDVDERDERLRLPDSDFGSLVKFPPGVGPAANGNDILQLPGDVFEPGICVGLEMPFEVFEDTERMVLGPVLREVEEHELVFRRGVRILPGRLFHTAQIRPHVAPTGALIVLPGLENHRRIVGVYIVARQHGVPEMVVEGLENFCAVPDPVAHRALGKFDAVPLEHLYLTVQWQMIAIFADNDLRQQADIGLAAVNRFFWNRCSLDSGSAAPVRACVLRADTAYDIYFAGLVGELLGYLLSDPYHRKSCRRACLLGFRKVDDPVHTFEMVGDLKSAIEFVLCGLSPAFEFKLHLFRFRNRGNPVERAALVEEEFEPSLVGMHLLGAASEHPVAHHADRLKGQRELLPDSFKLPALPGKFVPQLFATCAHAAYYNEYDLKFN